MDLHTLTPGISTERWSHSWLVTLRRFVAGVPESRHPAQTDFALDDERTARDIGLSTIKIRYGDLTRETGIDAELRSR